jgi:hypothetical protein
LNAIENFNGMVVDAITSSADGNTNMVEVWMDIQFKGAPSNTMMKQVAVQKWHEGLIVEEKFYHK